jgi:hypothetical protein
VLRERRGYLAGTTNVSRRLFIPFPRLAGGAAWLAVLALVLMAPGPAAVAQQPAPPDSIRDAGVLRASATVDSVFVDRVVGEGYVGAGDWASYLMARLGIFPIPPDVKIEVTSDTGRIVLRTHVGDLPPEARQALGPLLAMVPAQTEVGGDISLLRVAREVVQFRLETVRINGVPIPEPILQSALFDVGRQYPALTKSGRDLFVEIPRDARVELGVGRVHLVGPPADSLPPTR